MTTYFFRVTILFLLLGAIACISTTLGPLTTTLMRTTTTTPIVTTTYTSTSTSTSTTTSASTTTPHCGEWSSWSCSCCGGCPTQRCMRSCQATPECPEPSCSGEGDKLDSTPCTSPSETCKFPLPVCCVGQEAYVNFEAVARWCRAAS